jgi:hypothetical protein
MCSAATHIWREMITLEERQSVENATPADGTSAAAQKKDFGVSRGSSPVRLSWSIVERKGMTAMGRGRHTVPSCEGAGCRPMAVCHECRLGTTVRNCTRDGGGPFEVAKSDGGAVSRRRESVMLYER